MLEIIKANDIPTWTGDEGIGEERTDKQEGAIEKIVAMLAEFKNVIRTEDKARVLKMLAKCKSMGDVEEMIMTQ